jgi:hypothetical protein
MRDGGPREEKKMNVLIAAMESESHQINSQSRPQTTSWFEAMALCRK